MKVNGCSLEVILCKYGKYGKYGKFIFNAWVAIWCHGIHEKVKHQSAVNISL